MKKVILSIFILLFVTQASAQNEKQGMNDQELIKLSNEWMLATMNRDAKTLNKIVAPEFTLGGTDFENPRLPRDIWLKNTMENLKIDSINYNKIRVEVIEHVAIVQSIFYWSVAFKDMPAKKDTVNLVDTWIKRDDSWQVVSRLMVD